MTRDNPSQIVQDFLDRQGEATLSGDVDATLSFCDIPCTLESMQGCTVATNETEMRTICDAFIQALKARRLTHMVRRCLTSDFKDDSTIWASYETRYVQDGKFLSEDPYVAFVILRYKEDRWKISAMRFEVTNSSPANVALRDLERLSGQVKSGIKTTSPS